MKSSSFLINITRELSMTLFFVFHIYIFWDIFSFEVRLLLLKTFLDLSHSPMMINKTESAGRNEGDWFNDLLEIKIKISPAFLEYCKLASAPSNQPYEFDKSAIIPHIASKALWPHNLKMCNITEPRNQAVSTDMKDAVPISPCHALTNEYCCVH